MDLHILAKQIKDCLEKNAGEAESGRTIVHVEPDGSTLDVYADHWNIFVSTPREFTIAQNTWHIPARFQFTGQVTVISVEIIRIINDHMPDDRHK